MVKSDLVGEIVQGAIALVIVLASFGLAAYALYRGEPAAVSIAIITGAVGPIAGFYFGKQSVIAGVTHATNGMTDSALKMASQRVQAETEPTTKQEAA